MSSLIRKKEDLALADGSLKVGHQPDGSTVKKNVYIGLNLKKYIDDFDPGNDDDQAVHDALTWVGAKQNGVMNIHAGKKYTGLSQIIIPSGVTLKGSGERLNGLEFNTSGVPSILFGNGYYQRIEDINITHLAPGSANTAILWQDNDGVGSGSDSAQFPTLKNVRINNHVTGVRGNSENTWARLVDVVVTGCSGTAFSFTNPNFLHFLRCIADTNLAGWFIESCTKAILDACTSQVCSSNSVAAVQIKDCDNVEVNHLWTERNGFHNVQLLGANRQTRLTECLIQGAGFTGGVGRGLLIGGTSKGTIVDGGWFGGNATNDITTDATTSGSIFIEPRSNASLAVNDSAPDSLWLSRQMRGIQGISATGTPAKNLRGSVTISNTDTAATVVFPNEETNQSFFIVADPVNVTGAPSVASWRHRMGAKSNTGFTLLLEAAPGAGSSITYDWIMVR